MTHTLYDRTVSLTNVLAGLLWTLGFLLCIADLFTPSDDLGHLGILFAAAGGVLNIRLMFCKLDRQSRNAFQAGRDLERGKVRSLR